MKTKELVVFWDWNGTLIDDAFVFVHILNVLLKKNNLPKINLQYYKENFCFPVVDFYKKLGLYKNASFFSLLNKNFILLYEQQKNTPKLKANILSLIKFLNKKQIKQCVVSAQNNSTLNELVSFYGVGSFFVDVVGVNNDLACGKKKIAKILKNKFAENKKILVVGDTFLDFDVANHIGADCVLVDWGHNSFEHLSHCGVPVFSSVKDLKRFFVNSLELTNL